MADEAENRVEHDISGLTGTPLSDITDTVTDRTTSKTVKAGDFKVPPVRITKAAPKPKKPEYKPFKW